MLDWWSKYFASIETLTEVSRHKEMSCVKRGIFKQKKQTAKIHLSRTGPLVLQALKAQEAALSDSEDRDEMDITDGRGEKTELCVGRFRKI